MRSFFKQVFATMVGFFIAQMILITILAFLIVGAVAVGVSSFDDDSEEIHIKKGSVLHIKLTGVLKEKSTSDDIFEDIVFDKKSKKVSNLTHLIHAIYAASDDERISGMFIEAGNFSAGYAQLSEIMEALTYFKEQDKFILSYASNLTQKYALLMSASDESYINPNAFVDFRGLGANILMYKGLLDKLGIEMYVFRNGKFKSFVEPYTQNKLSNENRLQIKTLLTDLQSGVEEQMADNLEIPLDSLQMIYSNWEVQTTDEAIEHKLISAISYRDEMEDIVEEYNNAEEDFGSLNLIRVADYETDIFGHSSDVIAVLHIEGAISDSDKSDENTVGLKDVLEAIEDIKDDSHIKGVIVRVNSPGGSATASDIIYHNLIELGKDKPIFVSMANVAASGGYYIACAAEKIFADKQTITGSIGVFGLIPNLEKTNEKIGLNVESVKTYDNSNFGTIMRTWDSDEKKFVQKTVDEIYDRFIGIVAEARDMSKDNVHEIAQGRVWSGQRALKNGLVDDISLSFYDVIAAMAEETELIDYSIMEYPVPKNKIEQLVEDILHSSVENYMLSNLEGEAQDVYADLIELKKMKGVQLRMPYDLKIN